MYEVIYDPEVLDQLLKLEKDLSRRIWNKVAETKNDPYHYFERLQGRDDYKLRVGDYRIIADIIDEDSRIQITLVGHRKNIYKKLRRL